MNQRKTQEYRSQKSTPS